MLKANADNNYNKNMEPDAPLGDWVSRYRNDASSNEFVHRAFTQKVEDFPLLFNHRVHFEKHKLGFGDRAFHYMWYLILKDCFEKVEQPSLLEIGVYKGQIISLWAVIAQQFEKGISIHAISPLEGHVAPKSSLLFKIKSRLSKRFREDVEAGNFYDKEDYQSIIEHVFNHFNVQFSNVKLYKGYSTDKSILMQMNGKLFDVIYIDGDHSKSVVEADIRNYSPYIKRGGLLVMDDASCHLPGGGGSTYWKGHQSVSDACEIIPDLGFTNILNVGHNRIYQKA